MSKTINIKYIIKLEIVLSKLIQPRFFFLLRLCLHEFVGNLLNKPQQNPYNENTPWCDEYKRYKVYTYF